MLKLTINDMEIEVKRGTSILQAAEQLGIEVPRFCYHDKLSVPANCRMCLVEVEGGPPKPAASCAMACGEGMVVHTDSPMVKKARKGVMEMMLINHPLDCPVCDQGGECDLQDQAVSYGFDRSRFHENKRAVPDKDFGPLIGGRMTRCINCTRCIRFMEEIAGTPVLGQVNRGEESEVTTFVGKKLSSELSGNLVDVCPVGALTSKPHRFSARPWELRKTDTIDVHDAVGSNIRVDARGRDVLRVLPRLHEGVNEEWISDRTRHAVDGLSKARIDRPYIRDKDSGALKAASWPDALAYIAAKVKNVKGEKIAALAGDLVDVESMVVLKDLIAALGSSNIDCRTDGSQIDSSNRSGYVFNSTIEGIEDADAILIIGSNPQVEATMVNARIRKAILESRIKVGLIGEQVELDYKYEYLGQGAGDVEALMKSRSGFAKVLKDAKNPIVILGNGATARKDGAAVQNLAYQAANKFGAVFNVLHSAASRVGGLDIGFTPVAKSKGFTEILEGTKDGSVEVLYLLGADEFDARADIGWKTFVIYQGHHGDHGASRADVVLPGAAYTEKDGIYVNTEGRVQMARKAVASPGEAKEDWKILRAVSTAVDHTLPYDTGVQLHMRIMKEWPHFDQLDELASGKVQECGKAGKVLKAPFVSAVSNFYMSNAICRASDTMAQCVHEFLHDDEDMLEAAE